MTNREWLLNKIQNMSDEELYNTIRFKCVDWVLKSEIRCESKSCRNCVTEWLKSEHKEQIKLSDAERVILENVDKRFKWIARNKEGALYIYIEKPYKYEKRETWDSTKGYLEIDLFKHLFQFIKWEDTEPYNIEELLKVN